MPAYVTKEFDKYLKCGRLERPPIALERLSTDTQGRVVYRYRQPFRDGSTHVVLEPLDFLARLAALVPRPRLNLTRFHGVFAPNFKYRARIVAHHRQQRVDADKPRAPGSWMQCLKRVFAIDIESCPECGGKLQVIACDAGRRHFQASFSRSVGVRYSW